MEPITEITGNKVPLPQNAANSKDGIITQRLITRYYRQTVRPQQQTAQQAIYRIIYFATTPRKILQPFIRRGFGERYFHLSFVINVVIILGILPLGLGGILRYAGMPLVVFKPFIGWYVFLAAFVGISVLHLRSMRFTRSVFDFSKYSYDEGRRLSVLDKLTWRGKPLSPRVLDCYVEPALFFLAGIFCLLAGQAVGLLLIVCSYFYFISYKAAYRVSDNSVLDIIDEHVCGQEFMSFFTEGIGTTRRHGPRMHLPESPEDRQRLMSMMRQKEAVAVE